MTATATTGARPAAPHAPAKPAAQPSTFPRLAAIDIGTNSIRLVVAEVQPDGTSTDVRPPFVPIVRRPSLRTPHGEPAPA